MNNEKHPPVDLREMQRISTKLRVNIVKMIANAGSGHNGGSLSAIDMITYLYFHQMRVRPEDPQWADRDRFVLSKGHCCPALYAALAERGFFAEEVLWTLRDIESKLQGHPDMRKTPGVDMTTGSLGQGISSSVGIALGGKLDGKEYNTFTMVSDGELQEGQVWEAAMAAGYHKLERLIVLVDNNKLQTDGFTANIMKVEPIEPKFEAFGWSAQSIDGHDYQQIHEAVLEAVIPNGKPRVIVADTIKGKGVSFMENQIDSHSGATQPEKTEQALNELENFMKTLDLEEVQS